MAGTIAREIDKVTTAVIGAYEIAQLEGSDAEHLRLLSELADHLNQADQLARKIRWC